MSVVRMTAPIVMSAIERLSKLVNLDAADLHALEAALHERAQSKARAELLREGHEVGRPKLLLSGWAARVRLLDDGRRQFLSMILPGDLIGLCRQPQPLAVSTVVALTDVEWCAAPIAEAGGALADAYAMSHAYDEALLLAQITRLGRMTAAERICDLMLELHERLALAGLAAANSFDMPLTQEALGDALGLTSVHVNRTVQALRREGSLQWKQGRVTLADPAALARAVGRAAIRVSAAR